MYETVQEHFKEHFQLDFYDGSFGTKIADIAREDFNRLSAFNIMWTQVHGDVKDIVKRSMFEPYPHWTELYDCCKRVLKSHAELNTQFCGDYTCARIMGDAMALLRARHGYSAPRWWLPVMKRLRESEK